MKPFRNRPGTGRIQRQIRYAFVAAEPKRELTTQELMQFTHVLQLAAANPPRSGTVSKSHTMTLGFMQIAGTSRWRSYVETARRWALATSASSTSTISRNSLDN
jgi:hypothetical protein